MFSDSLFTLSSAKKTGPSKHLNIDGDLKRLATIDSCCDTSSWGKGLFTILAKVRGRRESALVRNEQAFVMVVWMINEAFTFRSYKPGQVRNNPGMLALLRDFAEEMLRWRIHLVVVGASSKIWRCSEEFDLDREFVIEYLQTRGISSISGEEFIAGLTMRTCAKDDGWHPVNSEENRNRMISFTFNAMNYAWHMQGGGSEFMCEFDKINSFPS